MATIKLRNGIDFPTPQQLAVLGYVNNYHGSAIVSDEERFIYFMSGYGQSTFYRYDTFTDAWTRLTNTPVAPSTSAYSSDMTYDPTRQRIYVCFGGSTAFYYYDINTNIWSGALAVLPVAAGAGANLKHTCSGIAPTANDDYIYYFAGDGGSRKLYRYVISTNTWGELGTDLIPIAAPSYGANMFWGRAADPDKIYIFRGAATRYFYEYTISTNTMSTSREIKGSANTFGAGTISDYDDITGEVFWVEAGERQLNKTKLRTTAQETGTATGATARTLIDTSKKWILDNWANFYVTITGGTGAGQTRFVMSCTDTTLTIDKDWTVTPDSTSTYEIKFGVLDYGTVSTSTTTVITDSSRTAGAAWLSNQFQYEKIKIITGTGAGQERGVASNTTNTITVDTAWSVTPDATSKYEILGWKTTPELQIPYSTSNSYYGNSMITMVIQGLRFVYFSRKNTTSGEWFRFLTITP